MANISSTIWAARLRILARWGSMQMVAGAEGLHRFVEYECYGVTCCLLIRNCSRTEIHFCIRVHQVPSMSAGMVDIMQIVLFSQKHYGQSLGYGTLGTG